MLEQDLNMRSIKTLIFINVFIGFFLTLSQVFASNLDEVICSAMTGMVEQESKKIPFDAGEFSVVGISVDCEKKILTTEKKHIDYKKADFKLNFQENYQKNWEKSNCSNMIFNTDTGWSTVQLVKGNEGFLVAKVRADFSKCTE